jgi:hypothetical protein
MITAVSVPIRKFTARNNFGAATLHITRTVYLIGLSRFLQSVPVTYAGNCHEVDRQKQFRSNVQSNYGGYTSNQIQ